MRGRPAPRPGVDALPRPAGDGRRLRLVQGRGLRGGAEAGGGRVLRLRAPRHGAATPRPEVPPHRRRAAQARRGRGHVPRRGGALPPRLRPVAARPDGAPRRPGRRLSPGLPPLQRRLPHTLPLVPRRADGRRRDASRWEDGRHRQAGTLRRPVRLRQAALAAARRADARSGACPHGRRRAAQARPQAALGHRGPGPVHPGARGGPGRSGRPDMEPAQGRRFRRPALRPRPDRTLEESFP